MTLFRNIILSMQEKSITELKDTFGPLQAGTGSEKTTLFSKTLLYLGPEKNDCSYLKLSCSPVMKYCIPEKDGHLSYFHFPIEMRGEKYCGHGTGHFPVCCSYWPGLSSTFSPPPMDLMTTFLPTYLYNS
jgi:hypothetical protein